MNTPKGKVRIVWSPKFAYAIGLLVSDGNLSPDGRHINFTTKDEILVIRFLDALCIQKNHIGKKSRAKEMEKKYFCTQFSDVLFYRFLLSIGLMPNKSLILREITIPNKYFSHFVRGFFDGDGTSISYWDKRWKSSFMYYIHFASASPIFLQWLQNKLLILYGLTGAISGSKNKNVQQLSYAKKASAILTKIMYKNKQNWYLPRKYLKIMAALSIVSPPLKNARMEKLVNSSA